jgi:hypothetical protein
LTRALRLSATRAHAGEGACFADVVRLCSESDEETLAAVLCLWWESNKAASVSELRIEGSDLVAIDGDGGRHALTTPCTDDAVEEWVDKLPT